jgi:chemotaxis signal transduction protein
MKLFKFLIFKINQQKIAIRTSTVYNIVEKAKIADIPFHNLYFKAMFSFRGIYLPLLDIKKILGLSCEPEYLNKCVLIVEVKINECIELVGIPIDEVIEVTEIDDLFTYKYHPVVIGHNCDLNESIVLYNGEPVIILNVNHVSKSKLCVNIEKLHPLNLLVN